MKRHTEFLRTLLLAVTMTALLFAGCAKSEIVQQETADSNISGSTEQFARDDDRYEIYYGQSYTQPEAVAAYLYEWEELPPNFITKAEAEQLGWQSNKGNLWEVAPDMSIGGDKFGNREGLLPKGEEYRECDVNYEGGYRGEERLVYSTDDYDIYYTADHYESFEQIYDAQDGYVWDENIIFE